MNTMYHLWIFILLIGMYVYLCIPLQETFVSTGFQIHDDFYQTNPIQALTQHEVKHIIIIPFLGMNKLNLFSKKIKELDTTFEQVYIYSVDVENESRVAKLKEFLSTICPDIIDISAQAVVLTKNKDNVSQHYMYLESTDTVLLHKVNQLLFKLIKESQ